MEKPEAFIIDANAFITPYRQWLISAAMANNYTVITLETGSGNLQRNQPSADAKIPDICKQFNVKCGNLLYLMRSLSFRIGGD
jgi:hypothetical protein